MDNNHDNLSCDNITEAINVINRMIDHLSILKFSFENHEEVDSRSHRIIISTLNSELQPKLKWVESKKIASALDEVRKIATQISH